MSAWEYMVEEDVRLTVRTENNEIVSSGRLQKGSIVRLKQFQANSVKDKP